MISPTARAAAPVTLQNLGVLSLKMGDNDLQHRWGGSLHPALTGKPVRELQEALIAVGTLKSGTDGQFGHGTYTALKRFQWYLDNLEYRLKVVPGAAPRTGVIGKFVAGSSGLSGVCNAGLGSELASWVKDGFMTTTPLVRLNLNAVSNIETNDDFNVLDYPGAVDGEILVHTDFADVVKGTMNDAAKASKVILRINQAFRVSGILPSGAVVTPADKSQHLIGHAVDLNIVDGDTVNVSSMYAKGTETDNADSFIEAVKKEGIRWGGDFGKTDPPHFDDFVNPEGEDYSMNLFFAQHCYDDDHPMRVVS
jgi:hypothetical protein